MQDARNKIRLRLAGMRKGLQCWGNKDLKRLIAVNVGHKIFLPTGIAL